MRCNSSPASNRRKKSCHPTRSPLIIATMPSGPPILSHSACSGSRTVKSAFLQGRHRFPSPKWSFLLLRGSITSAGGIHLVKQGMHPSLEGDVTSARGIVTSPQGNLPSTRGIHPSRQRMIPSASGNVTFFRGIHPSAQKRHPRRSGNAPGHSAFVPSTLAACPPPLPSP